MENNLSKTEVQGLLHKKVSEKELEKFQPAEMADSFEDVAYNRQISYLPINAKRAWLKIAYPNSRTEVQIVPTNSNYVVAECRLYLNKEDEKPAAQGIGSCKLDGEPDPFRTASMNAEKDAYAKGGFVLVTETDNTETVEAMMKSIDITKKVVPKTVLPETDTEAEAATAEAPVKKTRGRKAAAVTAPAEMAEQPKEEPAKAEAETVVVPVVEEEPAFNYDYESIMLSEIVSEEIAGNIPLTMRGVNGKETVAQVYQSRHSLVDYLATVKMTGKPHSEQVQITACQVYKKLRENAG